MSTVGPTKLHRLYDKLADTFLDALDGEPLLDNEGHAVLHEGKPIYLRPKAAILKEAREFLKDNGIDQEPLSGTPIGRLAHALPTFQDEPLQLEEPA